MIRFATPLAFLLFIPLGYAAYRMLRRARSQAMPYPRVGMLPAALSWRQRLVALPPVLMTLGLVALVFAAARPQTSLSRSKKSSEAIAIEMAVDTSGSMLITDLAIGGKPATRLDVVKATFADFVGKRPDDLIGLVAFGGYATTRCPLTLDHTALLHILKGTEVPTEGDRMETMTALGDGLAMACARLAAATNIKSRIVILLSDGRSNAGIISPQQAVGVAKQQGVKVYTIGVGRNSPANSFASPMDLFMGAMQGGENDLDEATLKAVADATGGIYYNVSDRDGLERALDDINKLQRTKIEDAVYMRHKEHFMPFLVFGVAAVLLAVATASHTRRSLV